MGFLQVGTPNHNVNQKAEIRVIRNLETHGSLVTFLRNVGLTELEIFMAQVIEFHTLPRLTPTVKRPLDEQRGKVIPFLSQREVSDDLVCAAYEELEFEPSRWPECDGAPCRDAVQYTQPLILDEEPLLKNSSNTVAKSSSVSSILGLCFDDTPIES
jgi:hypothetical protein